MNYSTLKNSMFLIFVVMQYQQKLITAKISRSMVMLQSGAAARIFDWGGQASGVAYARCRRQCIEARSVDQSARSAEKNFRLHFSVIRMGSRGTFVLCTARSRCMRIDAAPDQQLDSRTSQG